MVKELACAVTHVRQETYFLQKWIDHYAPIVGRKNLHVVLDGSDWEPKVDLTGLNVEVVEGAPRARIRNDRFIAKEMSARANRLRKSYRYVLRMDCDEFVVLDPAWGGDWAQALDEVDEDGYIFALGLDVVQRGRDLPPIERSRPTLLQRPHAVITGLYSKPFVISRWNNWTGGAHRLINRTVKMSDRFVMFHLALSDQSVAVERHTARGGDGQHASHVNYIDERLALIEAAAGNPVGDFNVVAAAARHDFAVNENGEARTRPPPQSDPAWTVRIPDRFLNLV
ncbi:glycosyltransferase family 2 protein [Pontitalea aquivivens]|uniref:glycosyltransferase family 2 protein n=1 Tax=Pontitalea aquivivens TaxID=3388663 RepID=UPI003970E2EA